MNGIFHCNGTSKVVPCVDSVKLSVLNATVSVWTFFGHVLLCEHCSALQK